MIASIGIALVLAGSVACYWAAPHQKLAPASNRIAGWVGLLALVLGTLALLQWAGPATAIFIALTVAMLGWSLVPLAAAWARFSGTGK